VIDAGVSETFDRFDNRKRMKVKIGLPREPLLVIDLVCTVGQTNWPICAIGK
jgi:hypothetical protein